MTNNKFLNTAKVLILALMMSVGIQYVVAQTWTAPTSQPPQGNAYAPLNVGAGVGGAGQSKAAGLTIGTAVADPSPALIVPTGRVSIGAGLTPGAKLDLKGDFRVDITNRSGAAGRDAIKILASGDNSQGSILVNKPNLELWNSTGGVRAHLWVNGVDANGSVRIGGGNPAPGKVLTANNTAGNASWQNLPSASIGKAAGTVNDAADLDSLIPDGFSAGQCIFSVSPATMGSESTNTGINYISATVNPSSHVVGCKYSYEDDGVPAVGGVCNYTIICS